MAAGERGKAIEEAVRGFERGQEELRRTGGISRGIIQEQRPQLRADIGRQRGLTEAGFAPFIEAGTGALQDVQRGTTVAGLDQRIAEILGTETFQGLRQQRTEDVRGQLAAGGLSRSGLGLEEIANISPDLAFQIENQLFGRARDLSRTGFTGVERRGAQGAQLTLGQAGLETGLTELEAGLEERLGVRLAGAEEEIGGIQSRGRLAALGEKQRKTAARNKFIADIAGFGADIFAPGAGGIVRAGVGGGLEAF